MSFGIPDLNKLVNDLQAVSDHVTSALDEINEHLCTLAMGQHEQTELLRTWLNALPECKT